MVRLTKADETRKILHFNETTNGREFKFSELKNLFQEFAVKYSLPVDDVYILFESDSWKNWIELSGSRLENDAECNKRIWVILEEKRILEKNKKAAKNLQQENIKKKDDIEYQQYLELKKKFEK